MDSISMLAMFAVMEEKILEQTVAKVGGLKAVMPYIALVFGILLAVGFSIDVFSPLMEQFGFPSPVKYAGIIMTGVVIGSGSEFVHWFGGMVGRKGSEAGG